MQYWCSLQFNPVPVAANWMVSNVIDINGHFKYRESTMTQWERGGCKKEPSVRDKSFLNTVSER